MTRMNFRDAKRRAATVLRDIRYHGAQYDDSIIIVAYALIDAQSILLEDLASELKELVVEES